jgi:hypothetical protein
MSEIADFLMDNYYSKYRGEKAGVVPTLEQLEQSITNHPDKFVIVRDDKIKGVAVFLTLSDETYQKLESYDITQVDVVKMLLEEYGRNVHFVLLCADGKRTILAGMSQIRKKLHPKSISWWNPDFTNLHKLNLRS